MILPVEPLSLQNTNIPGQSSGEASNVVIPCSQNTPRNEEESHSGETPVANPGGGEETEPEPAAIGPTPKIPCSQGPDTNASKENSPPIVGPVENLNSVHKNVPEQSPASQEPTDLGATNKAKKRSEDLNNANANGDLGDETESSPPKPRKEMAKKAAKKTGYRDFSKPQGKPPRKRPAGYKRQKKALPDNGENMVQKKKKRKSRKGKWSGHKGLSHGLSHAFHS
jgi:hypothetical protein